MHDVESKSSHTTLVLKSPSSDHKADLEAGLHHQEPHLVIADADHIKQVLQNIIRAAIRKVDRGQKIEVENWFEEETVRGN